jgi:transposase
MSYSRDLRQRVLDAVDRGMVRRTVVETFQVSSGSLKRWLKRRKETGTVASLSPPGRTAAMSADQYPALVAQLIAAPDAPLAEHLQRWQTEQGGHVSRWTMSRAIRATGWTRKKRP